MPVVPFLNVEFLLMLFHLFQMASEENFWIVFLEANVMLKEYNLLNGAVQITSHKPKRCVLASYCFLKNLTHSVAENNKDLSYSSEGQKSRLGLTELKIKISPDLCSFSGEESVCLSSPLLQATCILWLWFLSPSSKPAV